MNSRFFQPFTEQRSPLCFNSWNGFGLKLFLGFVIGFFLITLDTNAQCPTTETFVSGSGIFTVPAGVTSITVETWGAGGRGTSHTNPSTGRGGGGGGGGYSRSVLTVTPLTPFNFTVGAGSTTDAQGGNSWFSPSNEAASLVLAEGGQSAPTNEIGNVRFGIGGQAVNGIGLIKFNGGDGAGRGNNRNGGGGSSAGTAADGNSPTPPNDINRIFGATAPAGGGDGGNGGPELPGNANSNGIPGLSPGGGGGGSRRTGGGQTFGGAGGNGQVIITYTIPANTIILSSAVGTDTQTVCDSSPITDITYTTPGATGATFSGLPAGVTGSWSGGVATITGTPSTSVGSPFTYTVTMTGGCITGQATATGTITVTAPPNAGTLSGTQAICIGGTSTFTSTITGGTWTSSNPAIATINSSTGSISGIAAGTVTMTYTQTGTGGCTNATATRTVTVTAPPNAGTLSGIQAICVGANSTFTSTSGGGTWTSSNTAIATINSTTGVITGVSAGLATMTYTVTGNGGCSIATTTRTVTVTGPNAGTLGGTQAICIGGTSNFTSTSSGGTWSSSNTGIATINASTGQVTGVATGTATMTYTVAGTGGCPDAIATRTVTVTAPPDAGTLSGNQAICIGQISNFTSTSSGGTWSSSNTGIATINSSTGEVTGVGPGTATLTYTVTGTGGCVNATATRTVTVTAPPNAGTLSGNQPICIGQISNFTSTSSGGTWTSSDTGIATINSTTGEVTGISAGTATMTYTVIGTGGCSNATATRTVTVTTPPNAGALSGNQAICIGQNSNFSSTVTGGSWSSSNTGIATINASTGAVTGVAAGTATMTYTVSGTGGCPDASETRTVTVTAPPDPGTLSGNQTICEGETTTFSSTTTGGTWSSSDNSIATINSTTGVITTVGPGTATMTYTVTGTGGCSDESDTRDLTVNENPTADAGPGLFAICQGATSAAMGGSVGGGATGGTWSGGSGTWTNENNPATATYTASPTESGNIQLTLTTTGGTCTPVQVTKFITVNANPIINVGPAIPALCQGRTTIALGGSVSGGATTGSWSGGAGTWTNANDAANATYTASASESGPITLTLTASNGTCVASSTKTITVNPNPVVSLGPALAAICQGQQSAAMGGSVTVGASALWSGGAGTWANADNANTARYTASESESGVITLTLTSTLGSCTVTATKTITVNPNPTASAGAAFTSPICQGQTSPAMGGSIGPGGATGLWTGGAGTWTNANNPATATYTAGPSESGTITLTLTATLGSCTSTATKTINVNRLPSVTATPVSQFRCDDIASGTLITLSSAPINLPGTTYEWTRTNPAGLVGTGAGTALSGTTAGTTLVGTFRNNTTANITTTYTITPVGPAPTFCRGVPVNVTVTVYAPLVAPVISDDQGVCVGGIPSLLSGTPATGGSSNYTYQWQRRTTPTGWAAANNIPGANGVTYQPPALGLFDDTFYYRLIVTDNTCGTVEVSNIITIENILSFGNLATTSLSNTPPTTPFCPAGTFSSSGSPITVTTADHAAFLTYRYILSYDPNFITPSTTNQIIGTTICTGSFFGFCFESQTSANLPQFTVANNTNTTITTTIEVIPIAYAGSTERCNITSVSFPVSIRPTPVLTATPASPTICSGSATAITLSSNITDNPTTYSWTASLQSGSATGFSNQASFVSGPINQTLINTGTVPAVVRYIITPRSSNCTGLPRTVDITVIPRNTITRTSTVATTTQTVCSSAAITPITYTTTGATGATVSGLPTGVTGVWSGNVLTISGTPNEPGGGSFPFIVNMIGGCTSGQVDPTGTITVNPIHTITPASDRNVCLNAPMTSITMTLGGGATGATVTGLPAGITPNISGNTLTIGGTPTVSGSFNYSVTTTGNACAVATTSGTITIDPVHTITAGSNQTVCQNASMTAITMTLGGGATGATVTNLPTGVSASLSGNTLTISGTPTVTGPFTYNVTTTGNSCTVATTSGTVTVTPIHAITAGSNRTVCQNAAITPINITFGGGATGATVTGLPSGLTAIPSGNSLTISGTPTESGTFNYSVSTTGNTCTAANTAGTITVTNPNFPISNISVANPLPGSPPYTSTFRVFSPGFTPGNYTLVYSTSGINQGPNQTITATVTAAGELNFPTLPYSTEGTTLLTINSIQRVGDPCPFFPSNSTAPYGVNCSTEFFSTDGEGIFYVPAGVSQVTIQVFGNGSGTPNATETISATAGGVIFSVFDGTNVFATEIPPSQPMGDRLANAIVTTLGSTGRIVFNFECTSLPPCSGSSDILQYTDDEGFTVVRFTGDCNWTAPDGLDEFEVLVVGGGGGGGFGEAAGGGGGGAVIYQEFTGITMNGLPGLQGATFNITVGDFGPGAGNDSQTGGNGTNSTFDGPTFDYFGGFTFNALNAVGGGGGGSSSINLAFRQGADGASGGGGAATSTDQSNGGTGSAGFEGGNANVQTFGAAGAGGGGVLSAGSPGTFSGGGQVMIGGNGGNGEEQTISGEAIFYGAGGGATSSGATVNQSGLGGSTFTDTSGNSQYAGGSGNNNGIGQLPSTYGSGGGAGRLGGSNGFRGVVYIRYPNFRILPVEFLYFNAKYNPGFRSGDLTWATAKEWENERFEIERSVNDVKSWETIGQVTGAGYSDAPVEYAYQDMKLPLSGGNIFYRLKQLDFDGDSTYSDTRAIKVEPMAGTTFWRVFPNPTTGDPINLELLDNGIYNDEPITVRVISATGVFEVIEGNSPSLLSTQLSNILSQKAAGVYTVEISWGIFKEYHKVILRR